ncbi:MAG: lycopene beta-cyclase CrtY [Planctomycetes bacterium]|nr:lycopene beta-cyclase CrtY [Planctomycetota bacterium]
MSHPLASNAKPSSLNGERTDYILVGGGLQSGLMALAISHHQPNARWIIIEQQEKLAGNHTWSFHETDLANDCASWAESIAEYRWPHYQIRVGGRVRTVEIPYRTCSSSHFEKVVTCTAQQARGEILTHTTVADVEKNCVVLGDGRRLDGAVVIDNRGPAPRNAGSFAGGFQKFWGFELELNQDWPHANPIVMDDQIDQEDGFRFIYTLPMERRRVLVEDTRFSNTTSIDREECLEKVRAYVISRGCHDWRIVREEHGVLPMPTNGFMPGSGLPMLAGGYRGGWFHAATGYSFPMALRVAQTIATNPIDQLADALQRLSQEHAWRGRFSRFLNRLLFELVKPQTRYQIFRRFYRVLGEPAIARFYGHRFTALDAFRIVVGVPPMGLQPLKFIRSYKRLPSRQVVAPTSNQPIKVPG